ncbi:MAG: CPBP family intramembrane glutamic endopeptidase [Candidatus Velthaea sp.]
MMVTWVAAFVLLLFQDRASAMQSVVFNSYLAFICFAVDRIVARGTLSSTEFCARSPLPTLVARAGIVIGTVAFVSFVYGFIANWVVYVPVLTDLWRQWVQWKPPLGDSAVPNLLLYALIPGGGVIALGASPRTFGFGTSARGTARALAPCLALPAIFFTLFLATGRMSIGGLAYILARNFLSSGFSEEVLFRGLLFSHLRPWMNSDVSLVVQAVAFALFHLASSLNEPSPIALVAYLVALNVIPGYLFGMVAQRTRSLAIPVAVHTSVNMMRNSF